jgi:hypothetical protein
MAMNKKWMFVVLGYVLLLAALGVTLDGSLALIAIDRLAQSERYTDEMDKLEIYRGFEIRAFEREQGRWRAEIRKADGSTPKSSLGTADTACRLLRPLIP